MKEVIKPRKLYEEPECVERLTPAGELAAYIDAHPPDTFQPFAPSVFWNRAGDGFEVVWESVPYYVETCGDVELCRCFETGRVVGVQFWGVKRRMGLREVGDVP